MEIFKLRLRQVLRYCKNKWYLFVVLIFMSVLTGVMVGQQNKFKDHFLVPDNGSYFTKTEMAELNGQTYYILPYVNSNNTNIMIRELNLLEKNTDYKYYLVDVGKYYSAIKTFGFETSLIYGDCPQFVCFDSVQKYIYDGNSFRQLVNFKNKISTSYENVKLMVDDTNEDYDTEFATAFKNASTYDEIISLFEKYSLSTELMSTTTESTVLYSTYGNYTWQELKKQIEWIRVYGVPGSDLNTSYEINSFLTATWTGIEVITDEDTEQKMIKLSFSFTNKAEDQTYTINCNDFKLSMDVNYSDDFVEMTPTGATAGTSFTVSSATSGSTVKTIDFYYTYNESTYNANKLKISYNSDISDNVVEWNVIKPND